MAPSPKLLRTAANAVKGVLIGEGANTAYEASTGESLDPLMRVGAYGLGGAAISRNLGRNAFRVARSALPAAAISTGIKQSQEANFGGSFLNPSDAPRLLANQVVGGVRDWASEAMQNPRLQSLWQGIESLSSRGLPFGFGGDNSLSRDMSARARAYLNRYHGQS
jgi:hypothetical protein